MKAGNFVLLLHGQPRQLVVLERRPHKPPGSTLVAILTAS